MGSSIQDYAKKINSRITLLDCLSLLVTTLFLLVFVIFLYKEQKEANMPVTYTSSNSESRELLPLEEIKPFASIYGKTYTFSWCMGNTRISSKNRIYFNTEAEALHSGRTLSKLCKK